MTSQMDKQVVPYGSAAIRTVGASAVKELIQKAAATPRRRINLNFHKDSASPIQRLMLVMNKGTYVRPHRHNEDDKWEMAVIVQGRATVILFTDDGTVRERVDLEPNGENFAIETPRGMYHTWLPQDENIAFIEFKPGPYDPNKTNEFAPWAPAEGSPEADIFLKQLYACKVGDRLSHSA